MEQFEARVQTSAMPREFDEDHRTLRVRVQLAAGDLQGAGRWADQLEQSDGSDLHGDIYRLTLARVRFAQQRWADVERLLAGVTTDITAGSQIARQLEANLLLAAAAAGQGHLPEALALIESSLALAEPEGYIRAFLEVGEPARDLLAAYLRSADPAHKRFAQALLSAFSPVRPASSADARPAGMIEPLSPRELEVLNLMVLGRTNLEIARQLVVAPGTVKAHSASIYRKLDVANRTEAVARARQLGLLP